MATRRKPAATAPPPKPDDGFLYLIPCAQGIQAGRTFWIGMLPISLLKKVFPELARGQTGIFLKPLERWQRTLKDQRVKKLVAYLVRNLTTYILPAVTVTIDADLTFKESKDIPDVGILQVPMDATFYVPDGQGRIVSLVKALLQVADLGDEHLPATFYLDVGLARRQQMFLDLNSGVTASKSNRNLFDQRSLAARATRAWLKSNEWVAQRTEYDNTAIRGRLDTRVFTLSALTSAMEHLLDSPVFDDDEAKTITLTTQFWNLLALSMPDWQALKQDRLTAEDLREQTIAAHAITLEALGMMGADLLPTEDWQGAVQSLGRINWERYNPAWEGLFMWNGRIIKNKATTKALKDHLAAHLYASPQSRPALQRQQRQQQP